MLFSSDDNLLFKSMRTIIRFLGSAIIVMLLSRIIPGVSISGFWSAMILVFVLALLNTIVKPILILFTIPVTFFTLGLFLLVINAAIIMMASKLVDGFLVDGFWPALLFSLLNAAANSVINKMTEGSQSTNE